MPKKASVITLIDLRPVALTVSAMEVLEVLEVLGRLVLDHLKVGKELSDQVQFAKRVKRSADAAVVSVVNSVRAYLHKANSGVQLMFLFHFSNAFNLLLINYESVGRGEEGGEGQQWRRE